MNFKYKTNETQVKKFRITRARRVSASLNSVNARPLDYCVHFRPVPQFLVHTVFDRRVLLFLHKTRPAHPMWWIGVCVLFLFFVFFLFFCFFFCFFFFVFCFVLFCFVFVLFCFVLFCFCSLCGGFRTTRWENSQGNW